MPINAPNPYQMIIYSNHRPATEHVCQYNGLRSSEIASAILEAEVVIAGRQDMVIRRRGELNAPGSGRCVTVPVSHCSNDQLSYVLFLQHGTYGWHFRLRLQSFASPRRQSPLVTPLMFNTYQPFQCPNQYNTILRGNRLFRPCVVDQFCKVESDHLEYLRHNQGSLRVAEYTSLREQLGDLRCTENKVNAVRTGLLYILPTPYVGDDRYMRQNVHDNIFILSEVGYPKLFLTMTCSSQWRQIKIALLHK